MLDLNFINKHSKLIEELVGMLEHYFETMDSLNIEKNKLGEIFERNEKEYTHKIASKMYNYLKSDRCKETKDNQDWWDL